MCGMQCANEQIKAGSKIAKIQAVTLKIHELPSVRQHVFFNRSTA